MSGSIGIVGGGQLGRMLTFAAKQMGFSVVVLDPTPQSPAGQVADEQIVADFTDEGAIRLLAEKVSFMTFEIELANADILADLVSKGVIVQPSPDTLSMIRDKWMQKVFLSDRGIPVPEFVLFDTDEQSLLHDILREFQGPVVLKARFGAYDGRGNAVIESEADIPGALAKLAGRQLYVERYIPFKQELAVIAARSTRGDIAIYPVVETIQKKNICHMVVVPARVNEDVSFRATMLAQTVMSRLAGAGVFGIEMFQDQDDQVLVNEIAPRVHNSGHFSIEACTTSQFEQHIRAITGLPLGDTRMLVPAAVMVNILGTRSGDANVRGLAEALSYRATAVHIYGKAEVRPERKMGHITATGQDVESVIQKAVLARNAIEI